MKQRHSSRHLFWRAVMASISNVAMATGVYPVLPHVLLQGPRGGGTIAREWAWSVALSIARPTGFLGLPGRKVIGPRPIVMVHGYAMNRANFIVLAARLAKAGLGPIVGFEYWTLGKTASAARRLGEFIDKVRAETGAAEVDVIGHSMGGVVGRYYVTFGGGDGIVKNLVTIGSPHSGTQVAPVGLGRPTKELFLGSSLMQRLAAARRPTRTRLLVIWSRGDALVSGVASAHLAGVDELVLDDVGHLSMLTSRVVADELIARLR
jgi:triacylglycerol esterase/lipase EstA (alpha/beta hydrolase family)